MFIVYCGLVIYFCFQDFTRTFQINALICTLIRSVTLIEQRQFKTHLSWSNNVLCFCGNCLLNELDVLSGRKHTTVSHHRPSLTRLQSLFNRIPSFSERLNTAVEFLLSCTKLWIFNEVSTEALMIGCLSFPNGKYKQNKQYLLGEKRRSLQSLPTKYQIQYNLSM